MAYITITRYDPNGPGFGLWRFECNGGLLKGMYWRSWGEDVLWLRIGDLEPILMVPDRYGRHGLGSMFKEAFRRWHCQAPPDFDQFLSRFVSLLPPDPRDQMFVPIPEGALSAVAMATA